jgi:hypothetical protein
MAQKYGFRKAEGAKSLSQPQRVIGAPLRK